MVAQKYVYLRIDDFGHNVSVPLEYFSGPYQ